MPANSKQIITWTCIGLLTFTAIFLFIRHKSDVAEAIQDLALSMRNIPFSSLLLLFIISIFCVPPFIGVAFLATLSGFVYGFPFGGIPATLGPFLGSLYCYVLFSDHPYISYFIERLQQRLPQRWQSQSSQRGYSSNSSIYGFFKLSKSQQEKAELIQMALKEGGFGMILLIRLCPLPVQLQNLVLALLCRRPQIAAVEQAEEDELEEEPYGDQEGDTRYQRAEATNDYLHDRTRYPTKIKLGEGVMDTKTYIATAFLGSFRFNIEAWIGSQLATLTDEDMPPEAKKVSLFVTLVGVCGFVAVTVWMYRLTIRLVKEKEQAALRHEQEQEEAEIGLLEAS